MDLIVGNIFSSKITMDRVCSPKG